MVTVSREIIKNNKTNVWEDIIFIMGIILTGWFLIGFYLEGNYLHTFYQDWIYHAWRVKTIDNFGMSSWDHIWSNGINHWRSYQYLQHLIVLAVVKVFYLDIPRAMMFVTVGIFIWLRVAMYFFLRALKIQPLIAFTAVIISFSIEQQWITIGDFSMFVALIVVPHFLFLWIKVFEQYSTLSASTMKQRLLFEGLLAFLAGSLWLFHPVVANALGGLFFFSIGYRAIKIHWSYFGLLVVIYFSGFSVFILPYLFMGYKTANPIFSSPLFLRDTLVGGFFGLGAYLATFYGLLSFLSIILFKKVPTWSRIIFIYVTIYIFIIYLAINNYIGFNITRFQISRAMVVLGLILAFALAGAMNGIISSRKKSLVSRNNHDSKISKGLATILLIVSAVAITESIKTASTFTGQPIVEYNSPVSLYFNNKETPKGSIYVKNVSAASYFGKDNLRFVNSYNEHLLPHPLSLRFSSFMRSEIAYTGIPKKQVKLIDKYISVLGIEYLVLPNTSPLIDRLLEVKKDSDDSMLSGDTETVEYHNLFKNEGQILAYDGEFTILKNMRDINYVYAVEKKDDILFWDKNIGQPTLRTDSYEKWDKAVIAMAEKIKSKKIIPIGRIQFIKSNKLFIPISDISMLKNRDILIAQSYDKSWKVHGSTDKSIVQPAQLRFIKLDTSKIGRRLLVKNNGQLGIMLENNWSWWHWPLQVIGLLGVLLVFITPVGYVIISKMSKK